MNLFKIKYHINIEDVADYDGNYFWITSQKSWMRSTKLKKAKLISTFPFPPKAEIAAMSWSVAD